MSSINSTLSKINSLFKKKVGGSSATGGSAPPAPLSSLSAPLVNLSAVQPSTLSISSNIIEEITTAAIEVQIGPSEEISFSIRKPGDIGTAIDPNTGKGYYNQEAEKVIPFEGVPVEIGEAGY